MTVADVPHPLPKPMPVGTAQFQAVIVPHRSLRRRGLWVLGGVICAFTGLTTTGLLLLGAWPVVGFNGAEIGLALWLLHRHARGSRASEVLTLTETELHIARTDRTGRRSSRSLPTAWLQAVVEERPGRVPTLLLVHRSVREEVGAFLGEAEKLDLADALRTALRRARSPVFDNPQLRADLPATPPQAEAVSAPTQPPAGLPGGARG